MDTVVYLSSLNYWIIVLFVENFVEKQLDYFHSTNLSSKAPFSYVVLLHYITDNFTFFGKQSGDDVDDDLRPEKL
ncbi:hypothetical protein Gasu2_53800 [Galdieria sulphuraria]|uniref:Uncharacterized protein n=1 Tax=Galdieria sulphuraria TaxID=130081 RepID=M2VXV0_GALSU|nr:uncharacterized protein Gasu_42910 [Galdieria sulphuraria]EME28121.1 hypothetical protein Gasu_42910 [Galdieria sulphuraria]GJD11241.1 hypothetical protein Gasu2_53800 [Galdieria sulphuraria]|eukprot:XP_005704641.1 hypothetical protein Gasu_42910 [Galdieria sulphuraria]